MRYNYCKEVDLELEIRRFYKAYVEDKTNEMTDAEAVQRARKMATEDFDRLDEDEALYVEAQDIVSARKVCEIYNVYNE